jgi:hypothetical protein
MVVPSVRRDTATFQHAFTPILPLITGNQLPARYDMMTSSTTALGGRPHMRWLSWNVAF